MKGDRRGHYPPVKQEESSCKIIFSFGYTRKETTTKQP